MFDAKAGLDKKDIEHLMSELYEQKLSGIALYLKDQGGVQVYAKKK
jgi:hypothetical protein